MSSLIVTLILGIKFVEVSSVFSIQKDCKAFTFNHEVHRKTNATLIEILY